MTLSVLPVLLFCPVYMHKVLSSLEEVQFGWYVFLVVGEVVEIVSVWWFSITGVFFSLSRCIVSFSYCLVMERTFIMLELFAISKYVCKYLCSYWSWTMVWNQKNLLMYKGTWFAILLQLIIFPIMLNINICVCSVGLSLYIFPTQLYTSKFYSTFMTFH